MDVNSVSPIEDNNLPEVLVESAVAQEVTVSDRIQAWYQACWKGAVKFLAAQAWEDSDWKD